MIDIKIQTERLAEKLAFSKVQTRKLLAVTLTQAAYNVQKELQEEMRRVFKNPTDFVLRSVFVKQAKIQGDLVTPAIIGIRGGTSGKVTPAHTLYAEIEGGPRRQKRSEILLSKLFPGFTQFVPGAGAPLNASGDIPGPYLLKVASALQAQFDGAANSPIAGSTGIRKRDLLRAAKIERQAGGAQFKNGKLSQGLRGYGSQAQSYLLERQAKTGGSNFFVGQPKGGGQQRVVYEFSWQQRPGKPRPNNPNPSPVLVKGGLKPILIMTRAQSYRKRLQMLPVAQRVLAQDVRSIAEVQAMRLFAKWNSR